MGRKKLDIKKDCFITLRINPSERELLETIAYENKTNLSQIVRDSLFYHVEGVLGGEAPKQAERRSRGA